MYRYGLVGNCNVSALVSEKGSIDWLCVPRPDGEPVFGALLDENGGCFSVAFPTQEKAHCVQKYFENTNILCTEISNSEGDSFRITDFCPRFEQHGRMFRPLSLFRIVEPIRGAPSILVICKPIEGWSKREAAASRGNSHLQFKIGGNSLRLTTNMPLTYLENQSPFLLKEKIYLCLSWNTAIEEDLIQVSERFLSQTEHYWKTWVKHCSIPSLFQRETIRSALTLKLHCFDDTGAILAALTTSLPEEVGGSRNWDYRFCWLRDAYFALSAFHNLGHFEEMEGFVKFLLNLAHQFEGRQSLAPVYALDQALPLPETTYPHWAGYRKSAPVRSNNQAAEHVQYDVYGEMILTLAPIFFDERFYHLRTKEHQDLLGHLAKLCCATIGKPDAGLWEVRSGWQEHSFTSLMSWAGLERLERIQRQGYLKNLTLDLGSEKKRAERAIERAIREGSLRNGPGDASFDAALSLLPVLRYPERDLAVFTIDGIQKNLTADNGEGGFYYRYTRKDDFGSPQAAFVVCSFWVAQALAHLQRTDQALKVLAKAKHAANHLGLFSEHFLPKAKEQLGNFPQAYSHVGLINAAFAVSPPWADVL